MVIFLLNELQVIIPEQKFPLPPRLRDVQTVFKEFKSKGRQVIMFAIVIHNYMRNKQPDFKAQSHTEGFGDVNYYVEENQWLNSSNTCRWRIGTIEEHEK